MRADLVLPETGCVERVRRTLREHRMVGVGERILVAVSGGADSVCLLHVLHALGYSLEVAHFDHQTRDGESALDAEFVRKLAEQLDLPFHLESRPVESEAREAGASFEEYARAVRYAFLAATAKARGCAAIATGHQADDQAETLLMRLLLGASPQGLAGIPPVREQDGVRIIRPLLACTRDEILEYLQARGIAYRTDRSNADVRHLRNRVRHELLPQLARDYNPNVREALLRLAEIQRCEDDFLSAHAQTSRDACRAQRGVDRDRFAALHPALQRRVVLMLGWRHGIECAFDRVNAAARFIAEGPAGQHFDLGGGVMLRNARTLTEVLSDDAPTDDRELALLVPGITRAFDATFTVRCLETPPRDDLSRYCSPGRQVFDAEALGEVLTVRRRRPGDRFTPFGMSGTRKLQDYFVDLGLPITERDSQLILTGDGRIAWIVGRAISGHAAVTPQTRRVIEVEVSHETEP